MTQDAKLLRSIGDGIDIGLYNESHTWVDCNNGIELIVTGDAGAVDVYVIADVGYHTDVYVDGRKVPVYIRGERYANYSHDLDATIDAIKHAVTTRKKNRRKNQEARERAARKKYERALEERRQMYGVRRDD